jgi:hypothetical protein
MLVKDVRSIEMGKKDRHHLWQRANQEKIFGGVIDDRTIELPERYHEKKINPLQQKGVGDAYLAGLIDHDFATGEIDDYDDEDYEDNDDED